MKHFVLITCVADKKKIPSTAEELYLGPVFEQNMAHAQSLDADEIFVISGKHHLLPLHQVIEPYDVCLDDFSQEDLKAWADITLDELSRISDLKKDRFTILASPTYRKFLVPKMKNCHVPELWN